MPMTAQNTTLVCGCPGAGKTTRLLSMIEGELASGTRPERIGYVTFGRAAIGDAVSRATQRFPLRRTDFPHFSTLHAAAYRALGLTSEEVLGSEALSEFSTLIGVPITGRKASLGESAVADRRLALGDRLLSLVDLARVRGVALREQYEQSDVDCDWVEVRNFATSLDSFKTTRGLVDFSDMLSRFAADGAKAPDLDVLFIDEAQDLSALQWSAARALAASADRVYVAGDDDQAIYGFAGAAVGHYLALPGTVEILDQSYRCPRSVQSLASSLLSRLSTRRDKTWSPRGVDGVLEWHSGVRDLDLANGEWLILARNRYLLHSITRLLDQEGLLYEIDGVSSADQDVVSAIMSWEALRRGERVPAAAVTAIYGCMQAGRGYRRGSKSLIESQQADLQVDLFDLSERYGLLRQDIWHESLDRVSPETRRYLTAALRRGEKLTRPRISVSTIHAAKGREAQKVALLTDMSATTYRCWQSAPDDETRVFYVGVTRAREELHLIEPQSKYHFDLGV
jgi:superfamily I DNA/RNA helicase